MFSKCYCLCKIFYKVLFYLFSAVSVDLYLDLYLRTFTSTMEFSQFLPPLHRSREIICFPVWIFDLFLPVESVTIDLHLRKPFENTFKNASKQSPASAVFTSVTWVILSCTSQVMECASEIAIFTIIYMSVFSLNCCDVLSVQGTWIVSHNSLK